MFLLLGKRIKNAGEKNPLSPSLSLSLPPSLPPSLPEALPLPLRLLNTATLSAKAWAAQPTAALVSSARPMIVTRIAARPISFVSGQNAGGLQQWRPFHGHSHQI